MAWPEGQPQELLLMETSPDGQTAQIPLMMKAFGICEQGVQIPAELKALPT